MPAPMPTMKIDEQLIAQLFDTQPDSVVWFKPLFSENETNKITDFEVLYCNSAACKILNGSKADIVGSRLQNNPLMDGVSRALIFEQCMQVWKTGNPVEFTYHSPFFDKHFNVQRSKVANGILSITRDRTTLVRAEFEKDKQTRLSHDLLENAPYGICLYESVRDKNGTIIDFRLRLCNRKSSEITGLSLDQLYTHTVKELMAIRGNSEYFEICEQVVETGKPRYTEYFSKPRNQWLGFSIVKFEDGYLLNYIDISETKRFEFLAKENAMELEALFNASMSGAYSAELVRDNNGNIRDLTILRVNDSFLHMFNLAPGQAQGKSLLSLSPGDDQREFLSYVKNVIDTGEPIKKEMVYDKPRRWYEFSMVRLDKEKISVTVNDITSQKQILFEIERQKNLLDNILKYSASGISVTEAIRDEEGKVIDWKTILANDAAVKAVGLPKNELLEKTSRQISPGLVESPTAHAALYALETGKHFTSQVYLESTGRWLELSVSRMDENHLINVFSDVSGIKEAQLQLEKSIEELKRSNANLEEFTYAASHDLKEPIRKIHFFSDRLKGILADRLTEEERKMFERMENATERMTLLVDDLLAYSHASLRPHEMEEIDLNEKIKVVLSDLELPVKEKKAIFKIGILPVIKGYRRQIQQLFQNLISNALKYTKKGIKPEITIDASLTIGSETGLNLAAEEQNKQFHLITVSDNGIGFEQRDAERIFNVFTRLHGNSEFIGTGVGLSIARKVVDNHKGHITARSEPGKGATFFIFLPAN